MSCTAVFFVLEKKPQAAIIFCVSKNRRDNGCEIIVMPSMYVAVVWRLMRRSSSNFDVLRVLSRLHQSTVYYGVVNIVRRTENAPKFEIRSAIRFLQTNHYSRRAICKAQEYMHGQSASDFQTINSEKHLKMVARISMMNFTKDNGSAEIFYENIGYIHKCDFQCVWSNEDNGW